MTAQTFIQIDGQTLDPSNLTLPASRENRDAWTRNGDVIEVDPAKVEQLKEAEATRREQAALQDEGVLKAIADVIADVAYRVSTGNVPANLTRAQARTFVRDQLRAAIRTDLGLN